MTAATLKRQVHNSPFALLSILPLSPICPIDESHRALTVLIFSTIGNVSQRMRRASRSA